MPEIFVEPLPLIELARVPSFKVTEPLFVIPVADITASALVVKLPVSATVTPFCSIVLSAFVTVPEIFVEPLPLMLLARVPSFKVTVPLLVMPVVEITASALVVKLPVTFTPFWLIVLSVFVTVP